MFICNAPALFNETNRNPAGETSSPQVVNLTSSRSGVTANSTLYNLVYESQPASSTAGYSIFVFPEAFTGMNDICRHKIGHGESVCIRSLCKIQHRGERITLDYGAITVAKNKFSEFSEPITNKPNIEREVLTSWVASDHKRSLDGWRELFAVANSVEFGATVSSKNISAAQGFINLAKDFRSPSISSSRGLLGNVQVNMLNLSTTDEAAEEEGNTFSELLTWDPTALLEKRKAGVYPPDEDFNRKQTAVPRAEDDPQAVAFLRYDTEALSARVRN
jgi:hypothetical protein